MKYAELYTPKTLAKITESIRAAAEVAANSDAPNILAIEVEKHLANAYYEGASEGIRDSRDNLKLWLDGCKIVDAATPGQTEFSNPKPTE